MYARGAVQMAGWLRLMADGSPGWRLLAAGVMPCTLLLVLVLAGRAASRPLRVLLGACVCGCVLQALPQILVEVLASLFVFKSV